MMISNYDIVSDILYRINQNIIELQKIKKYLTVLDELYGSIDLSDPLIENIENIREILQEIDNSINSLGEFQTCVHIFYERFSKNSEKK